MSQNGDSQKFGQILSYFFNFFPYHPLIKFPQKKLLIVSKSPSADIPFDDALAHIICFVTVVKDIMPFILPKTVNKNKK